MSRKAITQPIQASVLLKARRRCCICFGLNRDTSIKQGQIAHLDKNSVNDAKDNLAFLCFDHHDQYDSNTRQSKNFTVLEVKQFRNELHDAIDLAFNKEILFGEVALPQDIFLGHYIRNGAYESAEVKVRKLKDGRYHISGMALWGTDLERRPYGPNTGDIEFIADITYKDTIEYSCANHGAKNYLATFHFSKNGLLVSEKNWYGMFWDECEL